MSDTLFPHLFESPVDALPAESVAQWWPRHREVTARWRLPFERSVAGGFAADRVAWAFGAGYQAALRALDPGLPDDVIACLCVTEAGGNTPRAIRSTLSPEGSGYTLNGHKKWTTLGPAGALLLVVARDAASEDDARPRLKVARVPADAPGVRIETMAETRFVPELPHAQVHLDGVKVDAGDLLDGDGYTGAVKPFRSIEDIHINAAVLAYLVREARRLAWPAEWLADALACLGVFQALAALPALAPSTHLMLEGALRRAHAATAAADSLWANGADARGAARWARDRALFGVASAARTRRFASACDALGLAGTGLGS